MQEPVIEFVIFEDDGVWKLYRDGELLSPYSHKAIAWNAAERFMAEIARVGKTATLSFEDGTDSLKPYRI